MTARGVDPGVILRALRFKAEMAGFRLERGHYMDRSEDRADRWYVVPLAEKNVLRSGPGFRTIAAAAREADRLGVLRKRSETASADGSGR